MKVLLSGDVYQSFWKYAFLTSTDQLWLVIVFGLLEHLDFSVYSTLMEDSVLSVIAVHSKEIFMCFLLDIICHSNTFDIRMQFVWSSEGVYLLQHNSSVLIINKTPGG